MREWINLMERWVKSAPRDDGQDGDYDIFFNPSRSEAFKLMRHARYGDLRGLITSDGLYCFVADGDIHLGAFQALGLSYDKDALRIMLDREGPFINESDPMAYSDDPENLALNRRVREVCQDHPALRRIYGPNYILGCR